MWHVIFILPHALNAPRACASVFNLYMDWCLASFSSVLWFGSQQLDGSVRWYCVVCFSVQSCSSLTDLLRMQMTVIGKLRMTKCYFLSPSYRWQICLLNTTVRKLQSLKVTVTKTACWERRDFPLEPEGTQYHYHTNVDLPKYSHQIIWKTKQTQQVENKDLKPCLTIKTWHIATCGTNYRVSAEDWKNWKRQRPSCRRLRMSCWTCRSVLLDFWWCVFVFVFQK